MSDQLQNIRGRAVGRIADVIAQARQQAANPGDASFAPPSLDNPSRPKTPAGFDERINMDSSLSLYQMRTAANSRQQALLRNSSSNSSHLRGSMSKTSKLKELKAATQTTKPIESPSPVIDVEEEAVVPQSRMVNSTFNPPMLLRDLSDVELEVEVLPCGDISRMLGVQIQELIRFLQSLQRGTELSVGKWSDCSMHTCLNLC